MIDLQKVSEDEQITRYIDEKKKFAATIGRVKHNVFVPPDTGKLSAYRTSELSEEEIWVIGDDYVASVRSKPILGRADLLASEFTKRDLGIEPDSNPHERHCNVINWPESDWLQTAIELAETAKLVLRPS